MPHERRTGSTKGSSTSGVTKKRRAGSAKKTARKTRTTGGSRSAAKETAKRTGTAGSRKAAAKKTAKRASSLPYEVRRSTVQGRGAFATRDIRRGERIGEYRGERVSWEEADRRYDDEAQGRHHTFLFEVDDDTVIDAGVRGSAVKYINHSCDPNCEAVIEDGRVFIDAIRRIRKGEELFYDYNYVLDEPHTAAVKKRYPCWCGAKNCRGTILAKKR